MKELLCARLPRVPLANLPTPIEELPRLSERLGGPRLLVKRDDLTGLATGGNKTRKLEYLVAAAQAAGADTLVTAGAVQSNHCRQTAAAAARCGLGCTLVLSGERGANEADGNLLLDRLLGAQLRFGEEPLEEVAAELRRAGSRPYVIPIGGSNATGAAGYVTAMEECVQQLQGAGERVDWIVHATGSGGTQAGMVVGARALGFEAQTLGISVSRPAGPMRELLAPIANETAALLELDLTFEPDDFLVGGEYLGGGYGVLGDLERDAVRLLAGTEGLLVDPVYTGRAFGGLIDKIGRGDFRRDETVLLWHTGGAPALFAERYGSRLL